MLGPTLETGRLILRPPCAEDFDAWASFAADAETTRFIGGPMARATAWRSMALMAGSWALHGFGNFSVVERASGRWIGRVGPWRPEGWPAPEIGWALDRSAVGHGYAAEAARAAIDWALDALGWPEVAHVIAPDNARSIALARRLGAENRGPVRLPEPHAESRVDLWAQSAEEWRARRR